MFGKILYLSDNKAFIENKGGDYAGGDLLNLHLIFENGDSRILGEIVEVREKEIEVNFLGEFTNQGYHSGILRKASFSSNIRVINQNELLELVGSESKNTFILGESATYKNFKVCPNINEMFANHLCIFGNSGSGKSCGVARIIQNIFYSSNSDLPKNAHFVLFDAYGEYYNTFNDMEKFPGLHFKKITTELDFANAETLKYPAYFLGVDDLAILLGANDPEQLPVLAKAIDLVKIFKSRDPNIEDYKNDIIARTCLDILSSGKSSTQIRDQLISLLTSYNTASLNLDSVIHQPGYDRNIKQCLNIDDQGKINAITFVVEFFNKFTKVDIDDIQIDKNCPYNLTDLYYALEFALINEGVYTNEKAHDLNNTLKSRLQTIINSSQNNYFNYGEDYITKEEYIKSFFSTPDGVEPVQLVDINLSFIDDKFAKCLTKIFSKLFFEYTANTATRGNFSVHIILEEAHRYVQQDTDTDVIGYNIFDRITKEGRKYGTLLGFVTQRPSELSVTSLSQCSNFVVFRLFYPEDLRIVQGISSNVTDETIERIKTLHPGVGLVFGNAFKVPLLVKFPLPNPLPVSTSLDVTRTWYQ